MKTKEIGFDGTIRMNSWQKYKIRSGTSDHIGISISPRNDNMFLWLDEELYFQNKTGRLFKVEFTEIEIKEKRESQ
jgi:hypothetical protein